MKEAQSFDHHGGPLDLTFSRLTSSIDKQIHSSGEKQQILGSYPSVGKECFKKLGPVLQRRQILPQNIYNVDEKGFIASLS